MKKLLLFLFGITVLFFSNCADREFDITGTWSLDKAEIFIDDVLVETVKNTGEELTFHNDGTGKSGEFNFKWKLEEDHLLMTEFGQTVRYKIREKERNKLVLEDREFEHDLGEVEVLTLIR